MHDPAPVLALLLVLAAALVAVQGWRLRRLARIADAHRDAAAREEERQTAARARSRRAVDGERRARVLLEGDGYAVLGQQVHGSWTMRADGEPVTVGLRADYVVARGGRRYVAEVKTGRLAPSLAHAPTRRQLLEYRAAFDVDGVVLVDADVETITHVELAPFVGRPALPGRPGVAAWTIAATVLFSVGVAVGAVFAR